MSIVSMKALLESGVHFGHRTHKWNPYMKSYIFTVRNGIHIIDLQKTVKALEEAYNIVRDLVADGGVVLFVGTKRQAQDTIQIEADRCGMPYAISRWLGGTLTNWITIRQRINYLERLERMRDNGDFSRITKKEALGLSHQIERLDMLLGGIRNMVSRPDMLFVVDVRREETAVHEANLLNIPVVAMVDTNCDPRNIDYIIPSNDDAIRAIKLIVGKMADAVLEGKAVHKEEEEERIPSEFTAGGVEVGVELTDDDLLGESTMAKIKAQQAKAESTVSETQKEEPVPVEEPIETNKEEIVEETVVEEEIVEEETTDNTEDTEPDSEEPLVSEDENNAQENAEEDNKAESEQEDEE
ncbi:MAG: 30S ribosomal protein S2 [Anaerolineales bacterium]|nr:30S ribosomal protein S2 [Anaerolineales bacterium]